MTSRYRRLDKILQYRISRERLYQRRAAVCRHWLQTALQRIDSLHQVCHKVRAGRPPGEIARLHSQQDQQYYLRAAQKRIVQVEGLRRRLQQRLQHRQSQLKKAAQYRRATETTLERIEQEVNQALAQNRDKELNELGRLKLLSRRLNRDVTAARG